MNEKMQKTINWLEKTYGKMTKEVRDGYCRVKSVNPNYPIWFDVLENGFIKL